MKRKNHRKFKNLFLHRDLQFRIIFTTLLYIFLAIALTLGFILYPIMADMFLSQNLEVKYQADNVSQDLSHFKLNT